MIIRQYEDRVSVESVTDTLAKMGFKVFRIEDGHDLYYSNDARMYTENDIRVHAKKKFFDKMVIELNNEMRLIFVHGDETEAKAFLDNLTRT
ncbi:MAG: hypothetical protein GQ567_06010 [Methanosarcinales archaeon]|jgi:predicted RNA binding protein YcfA (HicA-like mRNA interferase family)|nr:hypothetical protein [Methanosarcinales archaeon]